MPLTQQEIFDIAKGGEDGINYLLNCLIAIQTTQQEVLLGAATPRELVDKISEVMAEASLHARLHLAPIREWKIKWKHTHKRNERNAERMRALRGKQHGENIAKHQHITRANLDVLYDMMELPEDEAQALADFNSSRGFTPLDKKEVAKVYKVGKEVRTGEFLDEGEDLTQPQPAAPGMADLPDIAPDCEDDD